MPDDKTVQVKITANASQFEKAVDKAAGKLKDFGSAVKSSLKPIGLFTAAVSAAGVGTFMLANKVAEAGDNFQKMSFRTGISAENLSRLDFAAQRSGTNIQVMESALRYLTKAMADTKNGIGEAKRGFDALGVSVVDSKGNLRSSVDVLKDVSTKLSHMTNETEKISTAQYIFGARFGTQLLPLLSSGKNGLADLMKKSDELGYTWSTKDANAAATFEDRLTDLQSAFDGLKRKAMMKTFPIFEAGMLGAQGFIQSLSIVSEDMIDVGHTSEDVGTGILGIFENISEGIVHYQNSFNRVFTSIAQGIYAVTAPANAFLSGLSNLFHGESFVSGLKEGWEANKWSIDFNELVKKESEKDAEERIKKIGKVFKDVRSQFNKDMSAYDDYKKKLAGIGTQAEQTGKEIKKSLSAPVSWRSFNIEGISTNRLLTQIGSLTTRTKVKQIVEIQLKWDGRKITIDSSNNRQLIDEVGRAVLQKIANSKALAFGVGG